MEFDTTPLPWSLDVDGDLMAADRTLVAIIPSAKDRPILAAAPDLLAACQGAMRIVSLWNGREVPEGHEHFEEMKALHMMQEAFIEAIAKAEGKSK